MSDVTDLLKEIRQLEAENARLRREAKALRLENDRLIAEVKETRDMLGIRIRKTSLSPAKVHDQLLPIILQVHAYPEEKYRKAMIERYRWKGAVECRRAMIWLLRDRFRFSEQAIGDIFGFDHSTISAAIDRYEDLYQSDIEVRIRHAEMNQLFIEWNSKRLKAG